MSNPNFSWTNDLIFHLIDLVREKPELWDTSSDCFNNKDKKQTSWLEIANVINADVDKIQRKTKMLMSQFRREQSKKPGRKSRWFAYQKMSFLGPRPQHPESVKSDEGGSATYFISMAPSQLNERRSETTVEDDLQRKKHPIVKDIIDNYDEPRRKEAKTQPDNLQQKIESAGAQGKDEYATYGELVAMKLRKLGNGYVRSTVQYHINNILYKAEIGEFDKRKRIREDNSFQRDESTIDDENSSLASISEDYIFKLENDDSDD